MFQAIVEGEMAAVLPSDVDQLHNNRREVREKLVPTIMIADRDPRMRAALRFKFERAGYHVFEVGNGEDLLTEIEDQQPDVLVLDLMMSDMSGIEVLRWLKGNGLASMPVLVVGTLGHKGVEAKCVELGAAGFMRKPFSLRELFVRVEGHLA